MNLRYRSNAAIEDLAVDECTIHRSKDAQSRQSWNLWVHVEREGDGVRKDYVVAVNPGGDFAENGPGGRRTWGLKQTGADTWQVSPSINVLETGELHPGEHPTERSVWHQTPAIVGVPSGERWMP